MSRSSAPQVLERPGVERDTPEAPRPDRNLDAPDAGTDRPRRRRVPLPGLRLPLPGLRLPHPPGLRLPHPPGLRLPHPPGRRAPLWFAALIAGALLAAAPSVIGGSAGPQAVASDYGLGVTSELGLTGEIDDAGVRRSITEAEAQARLGELAASRAARAPKTVLPTDGQLTTCYCMRWGQMHWGVDLAAPLGTPILAAADGVVLRAGPATGFGNAVYIQDADGNVHIYGHMRYYDVHAGEVVHAGDQIAKVGNQGQSTGPHLHYEIHRGGIEGRPMNPQDWLAERGINI